MRGKQTKKLPQPPEPFVYDNCIITEHDDSDESSTSEPAPNSFDLTVRNLNLEQLYVLMVGMFQRYLQYITGKFPNGYSKAVLKDELEVVIEALILNKDKFKCSVKQGDNDSCKTGKKLVARNDDDQTMLQGSQKIMLEKGEVAIEVTNIADKITPSTSETQSGGQISVSDSDHSFTEGYTESFFQFAVGVQERGKEQEKGKNLESMEQTGSTSVENKEITPAVSTKKDVRKSARTRKSKPIKVKVEGLVFKHTESTKGEKRQKSPEVHTRKKSPVKSSSTVLIENCLDEQNLNTQDKTMEASELNKEDFLNKSFGLKQQDLDKISHGEPTVSDLAKPDEMLVENKKKVAQTPNINVISNQIITRSCAVVEKLESNKEKKIEKRQKISTQSNESGTNCDEPSELRRSPRKRSQNPSYIFDLDSDSDTSGSTIVKTPRKLQTSRYRHILESSESDSISSGEEIQKSPRKLQVRNQTLDNDLNRTTNRKRREPYEKFDVHARINQIAARIRTALNKTDENGTDRTRSVSFCVSQPDKVKNPKRNVSLFLDRSRNKKQLDDTLVNKLNEGPVSHSTPIPSKVGKAGPSTSRKKSKSFGKSQSVCEKYDPRKRSKKFRKGHSVSELSNVRKTCLKRPSVPDVTESSSGDSTVNSTVNKRRKLYREDDWLTTFASYSTLDNN